MCQIPYLRKKEIFTDGEFKGMMDSLKVIYENSEFPELPLYLDQSRQGDPWTNTGHADFFWVRIPHPQVWENAIQEVFYDTLNNDDGYWDFDHFERFVMSEILDMEDHEYCRLFQDVETYDCRAPVSVERMKVYVAEKLEDFVAMDGSW